MIKKVLVVILVICTSILYAQEGTSSPYSFYGIGLQKFKGTMENRAMGGLSIIADSIHLNLQNPASYGELALTSFAIGTNYNGLRLSNEQGDSSYKDNATFEYLAIGIPAGKFGFGFGVIPLNSVGYKLFETDSDGNVQRFSGKGGVNKVYLSSGLHINKNLSVGVEFNYKFGRIENKNILGQPNVELETRELKNSQLSGVGFSFGLIYKTLISEELELTTSIVSTPSFKLNSENSSQLASVVVNRSNNREIVINSQQVVTGKSKLELPAEFKFGVGIGQTKKWFLGAEYNYLSSERLITRTFTDAKVTYSNGAKVKLGGFYIPNYTSLTSYFQRAVYRAGLRYESSGLTINDQRINEFGMSFGVGLPVGGTFSNINISFEVGQRGTTDAGLEKEDFFNVSLGLSLSDKWFRKIKFN